MSCERAPEVHTGKVELYLLEAWEPGENPVLIDESTVQLSDTPLVTYENIISYTPANYTYKLTGQGVEQLYSTGDNINGKPFAMTANGKLVFTGFFWPAYYSAMCLWLYIDPLFIHEENKLIVHLGYPDLPDGISIPDKRNDEQLLSILRSDGKLAE